MPTVFRSFVAVLFLGLVCAGCSSEDQPSGPPPIYSSIVISGPDTLLVGQNGNFTATVIDTGGNPVASPAITFTSSSNAIATINNAGVATGASEGDVTIRASGGGAFSNVLTLAVIQGRGWVDQSAAAATVQTLRGVCFTTPREGWVVGDLGTILHTDDAGKTWDMQASNSTGYTLNAVAFVSQNVGYVVGSAGRVLRTGDRGLNWTPLTGAAAPTSGLGLNDIYFADPFRGWIVGNNGIILRTVNGGSTWTRVVPNPTVANLERISFPRYTLASSPPADPYGFGWAVGAVGTILSSRDFGQTWRTVTPFVTTDPLFGVSRRDKVNAIAVGTNNRTLNTVASGDSALWQLAPPPAPLTNFTAVTWPAAGLLPGSAWAVGKDPALANPVILFSDDGAVTWTAQVLPLAAPLSGNGLEDVFFLDERRGWAVGGQGLILHTATGGR